MTAAEQKLTSNNSDIKPNKKLYHLEGLRGIAALAVLVGHTLGAFWPGRISMELETLSLLGLFHVFYDGGFAVLIFFALSGYVLTYRAHYPNGLEILKSTAIKRYPRLAIPAFLSIIITYALMKLDLMFNGIAAAQIGSVWLGYFYKFDADAATALIQGAYGAIFAGDVSYNSSLWTLSIEFYGALLVIGLAVLLRNAKNWRYALLILIIGSGIWTFGNYGIYYGTLVAGLILGMQGNNRPWSRGIIVPAFVFSLWLGGYNGGGSYEYFNTIDINLNGNEIDKTVLSKSAGAILIVLCLLKSPGLQSLFSTSLCRFLGKISFSVYLIHVAIICSLGSWTFIALNQIAPQWIAATTAGIISISASIVAAIPFEKYIDKQSISLSGKLSKLFLNR